MIPIAKLAKLAPRHRMRKAALVLGELERGLMALPEAARSGIEAYAHELGAAMAALPEAPREVRAAAGALLGAEAGEALVRAVDALRHALLAATGQAPADWDLLDPATGKPDPRMRQILAGMRAYLEDIRSPFNVGAMFRTADAFGVEELLLSPACADPGHPRAERSAMGSVALLPWRRAGLEALEGEPGVFGLELGGTPIGDYSFPGKGIVIVGSEELGLSPEARRLCGSNTVSIPMSGAKASLNVSVAFGILMHAWSAALLV